MIKFKATNSTNDNVVLGFGLAEENIERLRDRQPIRVDLAEMGYPGLEILVFYGRDMGDLYGTVAPLIGPDTHIIPQGRLK